MTDSRWQRDPADRQTAWGSQQSSTTGTQQKVLLCELRQRTSAKGNEYLAGWLGKASLVGFLEKDDDGNEVWRIYATTPRPREGGR